MILEYRTNERDLVVATQVCGHWRSTLISNPSLWTCFRFTSSHDVDRTLTYLRRSKSALIDVETSINSPQDFDALNWLAPHIARTKTLIIQGFHDSIHVASLLFRNPAPSLKYLKMHSRNGFSRLPDDFLGQQASSLRFIRFSGVCPKFESPFPLPNLTDFYLSLHEGRGLLRLGALLRFFSGCHQLRKIWIGFYGEVLRDIALAQVTSLESLVELDYTCSPGCRILPFLRVPRLNRLRVSTRLRPGQTQRLADILPCGGHVLLAGATKMSYHSDGHSFRVDLSGNGVDLSFRTYFTRVDHIIAGWFSDETHIAFGRIEVLTVESCSTATGFPVDVSAFEKLGVLRVVAWDGQFAEGFFRLLHPYQGARTPCPSLREIQCTYPLVGLLVSLARERKQAGYQLGLVRLSVEYEPDLDLVEELREHVGEVRVEG